MTGAGDFLAQSRAWLAYEGVHVPQPRRLLDTSVQGQLQHNQGHEHDRHHEAREHEFFAAILILVC
jgi:hypothetical protein